MLEKHFGDIYAAARELGVPGPDLRRLTWAQPSLYKNALEEHELVVQRAMGELFRALDSDDPRWRMWAAEKIMPSYLARNHPFAPARRGAEARTVAAPGSITFRWAGGRGYAAGGGVSGSAHFAAARAAQAGGPAAAAGGWGTSTLGEPLTWATIFASSSASLQSEHFPHTQNTA